MTVYGINGQAFCPMLHYHVISDLLLLIYSGKKSGGGHEIVILFEILKRMKRASTISKPI
jgi:hypothetical protein